MQKDLLYKTVLSLLAKNCFNGVSMADISKELNIKPSSLYEYAKDKDELIRMSLEFANERLRIVNFNIDFKKSVKHIIEDVLRHYLDLFLDEINRYFFSITLRLKEYRYEKISNIEDITYMIDTQLFFILDELVSKKGIKFKVDIDNVSHFLSLMIIELIINSSDEEKANWQINKIIEILDDFLYN